VAAQLSEKQRMWRIAARYSSVGIQMAACVAIGVLGGIWLDSRLDTEPLLFWIGLAVGVAAGARSVWRVIKGTHLSDM
jgi:F0F1-type ATP synthase assembly protein I